MKAPPSPADWQVTFGDALLDPSLPVPPGLHGEASGEAARRFSVYRNHAVMGQVLTLEDAFPVTARLVGKEFFRAMARQYAGLAVPSSPVMAGYGESFPAFIRRFAPADGLPYLADMARLERAWVEAYHAAEARSLDTVALVHHLSIDATDARFCMHPSLRLVDSAYPAVSIWQANVEPAMPRAVSLDEGPESCLIVRPEAEVELYRLGEGGLIFFGALAQGIALADATGRAMEDVPGFDLAAHLVLMVRARLVIAVLPSPVRSESDT